MIRLLSSLPLPVLYVISDFLFFVSFYVVRYRRRLVQKSLRNSFPEKPGKEIKAIEKEFYKNLCDYAVEMLKLVTMTKEQLSQRMTFNNPEVLENFRTKNQSILFLASHQFNWEWILVSASINFPMAIDFVYQPINNKFFNDLTLMVRTRFGAYPIKRDEVARELVKRKNVLRGVASVADQYPGYGRDKKYITEFLNQETAFFMGTNQLALLTQYPALYYKTKKVKRGYYEASPFIIAAPPYPKESELVIENYVRIVEEMIREYPPGWLWSHNRWKKRHLRIN
ncbi:MAG: lysophospholipid acyltransferase family protein [Cyclobacteriaceae bacterium]